MQDIKAYYQARVRQAPEGDLLWQVGKTVNGVPVGRDQVAMIVGNIASNLDLHAGDAVLDIGCGNGLLTREVARRARSVTGVELTPELYRSATAHSQAANIRYVNADALGFAQAYEGEPFDKIYLYEVIQHVAYGDLPPLLRVLSDIARPGALLLAGGVPDEERKWAFYDGYERRCRLFQALVTEGDPLGYWYHRDFLRCVAEDCGMSATCLDQEAGLYTSRYRFDCLFRKTG